MRNALDWSDPNISLVMSCAVCFIGCLVSLIFLGLEYLVTYVISWRIIAVFTFAGALLPPAIRDAMDIEKNPFIGWLVRLST